MGNCFVKTVFYHPLLMYNCIILAVNQLLLLLLFKFTNAQIQASSSQRRWCSEMGNMATWEGKRGEF